MAKGIIYVMTTALVSGLVKIGAVKSTQYDAKIDELEHNGYRNIKELVREFAIEVDDYEEKGNLIFTIFGASRVGDTELFAVDKNIVKQLLSSFKGTQIYPRNQSQSEAFEEATTSIAKNGVYHLRRVKKSENNRTIYAEARLTDGKWTLLKGSDIAIQEDKYIPLSAKIMRGRLKLSRDNKLMEDLYIGYASPSVLAAIVMFQSCDGYKYWISEDGHTLEDYQKKTKD